MAKPEGDTPSRQPLRVLIVDDNRQDAELLIAHLKHAGYRLTSEIVDTPEKFREGLLQGGPDLVLCDFTLRGWNALEALTILRKSSRQIPLIIVTGTLGDEAAARCIQEGAVDYILKDRIARLPAAISRALEMTRVAEERKRVEAEKARLITAIENCAEGICITNPKGAIEYVNPAFARVTGYSCDELLGQNPRLLKSHQHNESFYRQLWESILSGKVWRGEIVNRRKDGSLYCTDTTITPVREGAGEITHFIATQQDISERKQAEDAVRRSEEQLRLLLDSTAEAIFGYDLEGRCTFCNSSCVRLLGYQAPEELLGKNMHDLVHSRHADGRPYPREECPIQQALSSGQQAHGDAEVFWHADGSNFPVEYWSHPIVRDSTPIGAVVAFLDITDRRRLEEQLLLSQKMEALGRLAGGVAHDFNNLLTIILGYAQLVEDRLGQENPLRRSVEEIKKAGERAASLTRQLLAFGRRQVLMPQVLDLNAVVSNIDKMLRRLIGEDIELVTVPARDLGRVKADPGQIEQIIMNLAVNARDAMPGGGKLTIETGNVEFDTSYAQNHAGTTPGPYIMLAVSDTGVGMDSETQARIFEPFFTTKEKGKGTGLGLATVYGIVKQSGGHIWVYSEPGRGTTFKIYFPRIADEVRKAAPPAQTRIARSAAVETILVVEDEEGVRSMVQKVLESCGYRVLVARSGEDALGVLKHHSSRVDLLVTDMVMPGMDGKTLADHMSVFYRSLKVLFMSGYTENTAIFHGGLDSSAAFLQKPFSPEVLAAKVRAVLDSPSARDEAA